MLRAWFDSVFSAHQKWRENLRRRWRNRAWHPWIAAIAPWFYPAQRSWFIGWRWFLLMFASAMFLGLLVSEPQWLHMRDERYKGIPVHLNSDEYSYLPRIQEALLGRSNRMGTAITGGEERLPELQPALIERIYGTLFRPTGWNAATVLTVMDFVAPFLLFFVLVGFSVACGLSRRRAFIVAWLFVLFELYNLGRPVHQSMSFLLTLLALWALVEGVERSSLWGILGGALMGMLMGVYFWSWTAAWAWWGVLLLWLTGRQIVIWLQALRKGGWVVRMPRRLFARARKMIVRIGRWVMAEIGQKRVKRSWQHLLFFGACGVITALPFIHEMIRASLSPLYPEAFFRSGIAVSHVPESWIWSLLFAAMAFGSVAVWRDRIDESRYRRSLYLVCTVVTAFLLLNQHVIHGLRFVFASHYLFFLVYAAVMALVFAWGRWNRWGALTMIAAAVFLAGIAYDNRSLVGQWRVDDTDFSEQHLADALPFLDALPRGTVLSDSHTSAFVASYTGHDVLYTAYVQQELRGHEDIAERYCLTQVALPPELREPERQGVLVYGSAYDAFDDLRERAAVRRQELALLKAVCRRVDEHPAMELSNYDVDYIFWDEYRNPDWDLSRFGAQLQPVERRWWWSLWKVL